MNTYELGGGKLPPPPPPLCVKPCPLYLHLLCRSCEQPHPPSPSSLQDPSAVIGKGCRVGPSVVVGPGVVIEDGACLSKTTILRGSTIRSHAWVQSSIIGWDSTVGKWVSACTWGWWWWGGHVLWIYIHCICVASYAIVCCRKRLYVARWILYLCIFIYTQSYIYYTYMRIECTYM